MVALHGYGGGAPGHGPFGPLRMWLRNLQSWPCTDLAQAAYAEFGMQVLPGWPKYSPDLNPQENVWSWVEQELRKEEKRADTFETFCKKMIMASRRYPAGSALIPSMAQRLEAVLNAKGGMTKY